MADPVDKRNRVELTSDILEMKKWVGKRDLGPARIQKGDRGTVPDSELEEAASLEELLETKDEVVVKLDSGGREPLKTDYLKLVKEER